MKNVTKKIFLSALITTTLVLSAAANASNGTKKPPMLSQVEMSDPLFITKNS